MELVWLVIAVGVTLLSLCSCTPLLLLQDKYLSSLMFSLNSQFILEILIVTVIIIGNVFGSIFRLKYPEFGSSDNYPAFLRWSDGFLYSFLIICFMCYIALNQPNGLAAIGLRRLTVDDFIDYSLRGIVILSGFMLLYVAGNRIIRGKKEIDNQPLHRLVSGYQAVWERLGFVVALIIGVVAEEWVYRGYLVLLLGEKTNAFLVCALLSAFLSVLVHLYQGRSLLVFHFLFAIVAIGVTIWTDSIVMAVSMHIFQDVVATIKVWNQIDKQAT
jgi:membrane protease YdiL (CAAX protease family)